MKHLIAEIDSNFTRFTEKWKVERTAVTTELSQHEERFRASYRRLVSLQAWRTALENKISSDSLKFFLEAQNDALVSHVLASQGSWRTALKSLRSCIENVLFCLYYKDHPVEVELWQAGRHRLGFTALTEYLINHPQLLDVNPDYSGVATLKAEYSTLSKAVHASSASFRMTQDEETTHLWSAEVSRLGAWSTRESQVLKGLNLLLLTIFREDLSGARLSGLRQAISLAIPVSQHARIKTKMHITLFRP